MAGSLPFDIWRAILGGLGLMGLARRRRAGKA